MLLSVRTLSSVVSPASEVRCFSIEEKASVAFDVELTGLADLAWNEPLTPIFGLRLVCDWCWLGGMKMIVLKEGQLFVMRVRILLCMEIDMRIEFDLVLDKYSHMVYINYHSDEIAWYVLWVHFPTSFRQQGCGVCSPELQQLTSSNNRDLVR